MPTTETAVQLNVRVPTRMHQMLTTLAGKARLPVSTYAAQLLSAAYAARVKPPTGDRDLDASVGMVAILWAENRNTAEIAAALQLREATVVKILAAWRQEGRLHG